MKAVKELAKNIKLLALDVDGVLTDGSIYLSPQQEAVKKFNAKDGMGISCAVRTGLLIVIITGRKSPIIALRAKELGITKVYEGIKDKRLALYDLMQEYCLQKEEIAYVGDDLNDLPALTQVGLACAPADAVDEVKRICHFISDKEGGNGAVRQVLELILGARGEWETIVADYLQEGQGDFQ